MESIEFETCYFIDIAFDVRNRQVVPCRVEHQSAVSIAWYVAYLYWSYAKAVLITCAVCPDPLIEGVDGVEYGMWSRTVDGNAFVIDSQGVLLVVVSKGCVYAEFDVSLCSLSVM